MIMHYQFKPLFEGKNIPGWTFSFYYKNQRFTGIYHQTGKIEWTSLPPAQDQEAIAGQIHELMLFHIYQ
ncbi:YheE family protein [Neobacillus muris]|uniref:YheE family protein n=1 Tax=Neobacillus muris TaxID=2941334 RepID=UPI00203FE07B|nr:YheE family protein [Neobacillus muris]